MNADLEYKVQLSDALIPLVQIAMRTQDVARKHASHISSRQWLNEYCTLKLGGTRGSGHTHLMTQIGNAYPSKRFLCVVNHPRHIISVEQKIERPGQVRVVDCDQPGFTHKLRGDHGVDVVFGDTANQMPKARLSELYGWLDSWVTMGHPFLLILLG